MKKKKKDFTVKLSDVLTKKHSEKRFVVVDLESNEILDDNKGEGFRTEQKAFNHYELQERGYTDKAERKHKGKVDKMYREKANRKRDISLNLLEEDEE